MTPKENSIKVAAASFDDVDFYIMDVWLQSSVVE